MLQPTFKGLALVTSEFPGRSLRQPKPTRFLRASSSPTGRTSTPGELKVFNKDLALGLPVLIEKAVDQEY